MNGIERIAAERQRQIAAEGFDQAHDDDHDRGELARAARFYALAAMIVERLPHSIGAVVEVLEWHGIDPGHDADLARMVENPARHYYGWNKAPSEWPWEASSWRPSRSAVRNLEKAGALIAAEIDRMERLEDPA